MHIESADKRVGLDLYPSNPRGYFQMDARQPSTLAAWRGRAGRDFESRVARAPYAVPFQYTADLCRGQAIPPKVPGRKRILVIGDSFTEGQGVLEADTFVARLARRFPYADFINCGRRGYDFPELASWFDRHMELEPDVVLYAMVLNDPQQSAAFHARQRYIDDWIVDRRRMVSEGSGAPPFWHSHLWLALQDRMESRRVGMATTAWYRAMTGDQNRDGWNATLAHIQHMDQVMRARGGSFAVALWPLVVDLEQHYPFEVTHQTISSALTDRQIQFHDTLAAFRGQSTENLWVHPVDHHPNEQAHAIFARDVADFVHAALARVH